MTAFTWTPDNDLAFGARITQARKKKGLTLDQVATELDVSKGTVGHWETGSRSIKHHDLAALCSFLSISADELLFGSKRWPFEGIEFESIAQLEPNEIDKLEGAIVSTAHQYGLVIDLVKHGKVETAKKQANAGSR
jgi:transcriptional regulator with XRE-family HTH domain